MDERSKALHADGRWLRDREGRVVLLRGINCGGDSKLPPFAPLGTEASAEQIRGFGMNAVRCCAVWEGVEPEEGRFDEGYLDRLERAVGWLTRRGIFVFIDMHQDLFSRALTGSGAPSWATHGDRRALPHPDGGPLWFMNYNAPPIADAFERFWSDEGLQQHFIESLRRVAARFRRDERVVGYEILNEPWHGRRDVWSGAFERETLAPFYERAIAAVREADPDAIAFVEPAFLAAGLFTTQSRLPRLGPANVVYAPHYYPTGALLGAEPDTAAALRDVERDLVLVEEKAAELQAPAILGEFGCHPRQPGGLDLVRGYYDLLDAHRLGGTIWTYALRDQEWNGEGMSLVGPDLAERPFVEAVVRPYPMATAGVPSRIAFDAGARRFHLEVEGDGDGETVIRVPGRVFGGRYAVEISDGDYWIDVEREELRWRARARGPRSIEITGERRASPERSGA